jgi:hypothetical protein
MPATRFKKAKNRKLFGKKGARQYEALRRQGMSRERAARITNAYRAKRKRRR